MGAYGFLWQADITNADAIFRQGLTSRIITAKHAALAMKVAKRGLIVEVTENDIIGSGGNPMAQTVKMAQKMLPLLWAAELAPHGVAIMAITPGFLRSESMLQHFGVTENNSREAGKKDPNFLQSESPLFVGRAVAALAADPKVHDRTGMLFSSWELAHDYGFTDEDGRRPDWGATRLISLSSRRPGSIGSARALICRASGWRRSQRGQKSSGQRSRLDVDVEATLRHVNHRAPSEIRVRCRVRPRKGAFETV